MSDRPRRSTRQPAKFQEPSPIVARPKRKAQDADKPVNILHQLLKSPKSALTNIDISDLVNFSSWNMLSPESQTMLKTLLPPTAFRGYQPVLDPSHPSAVDSMAVDQPTSGLPSDSLDGSVFTDSHFLAAAHTFQDHIYSEWLSDAHADKVKKFQAGILDGTLSAPWKDEVWEKSNKVNALPVAEKGAPPPSTIDFSNRAGEAAEVKLATLAKKGVIKVGDVIAYKRNFMNVNSIIEKDAIIQAIHPNTYALTVLLEPGSTQHLPGHLLSRNPSDPSAPTQAMTITTPSMLENGILDVDGRVSKSSRPNGNAWKCFTVWRWRGETNNSDNDVRGGRQNHGTLFYLRGSYHFDK
ncbi:Asx homology domain-containing protein [Collybia nuda]|uniref:Asx homology domain-containing protein n=1 Tax=Collybia nuda TaxID=64659 RepID=A0A9P6CHX9_9AGAR|nr:Asx homology domain-containing protein [Collybia nuda]